MFAAIKEIFEQFTGAMKKEVGRESSQRTAVWCDAV